MSTFLLPNAISISVEQHGEKLSMNVKSFIGLWDIVVD